MTAIFNQDFRDSSAAATYPFSGESTMQVENWTLSSQTFIDCLLYPLEEAIPPFYISELSALALSGGLLVSITDSGGRSVGVADCPLTVDAGFVYDQYGRLVGTLVYNSTELGKVRGVLSGRAVAIAPTALVFTAGKPNRPPDDIRPADLADHGRGRGICFRLQPEGQLYIRADGQNMSGDVAIVGARGLHFSKNPLTGAVQFNLFGEEPTGDLPIMQIDIQTVSASICCESATGAPGISLTEEDIWLAALPSAAVRVVTEGQQVTIGKPRDFSNG